MLCFMHGDSMPDISGTWLGLPADKVAHFIMFVPFMPLSYLTFSKDQSSFGTKFTVLTILLAIGLGLAYCTEIIQERLKFRSYESKDLLFDGLGLSSGYIIIALGLIIKKSRK